MKRKREIEQNNEDSPIKRKKMEDEVDSDYIKTESSDGEAELPVKKIERQMEFADILQDIDDLSEPACMDRILMYLEEIKDEDHFFMEVTQALHCIKTTYLFYVFSTENKT